MCSYVRSTWDCCVCPKVHITVWTVRLWACVIIRPPYFGECLLPSWVNLGETAIENFKEVALKRQNFSPSG